MPFHLVEFPTPLSETQSYHQAIPRIMRLIRISQQRSNFLDKIGNRLVQ